MSNKRVRVAIEPEVGDLYATAADKCAHCYRVTSVEPHPDGGWWCDLELAEPDLPSGPPFVISEARS